MFILNKRLVHLKPDVTIVFPTWYRTVTLSYIQEACSYYAVLGIWNGKWKQLRRLFVKTV